MQGEGDEANYFENGRVSADAIEKLFTAGRFLFEIKPWKFAYDSQVLRMDIPALGVDGDCVYVIGQLDESPGVLIFASFDGFQQFLAAGTTDTIGQDPDALGSELLALTFLRAGELPPSMRREAMEHAWPVASADRLSACGAAKPRRHVVPTRRAGHRDRHRLRPVAQRALRQARGDVQVGQLRSRLRVVLRRRRPGRYGSPCPTRRSATST